MTKVYWPYFDPEYENLSTRINPPSVSIDNTSCKECTLVKVDSMNKPGILLEVVQVLTDLDLTITKAYISSDGGWFMDVFHVTDQQGNKVTDSKTIDYIEKVLGPKGYASASQNTWPGKRVGVHSLGDHTSIEIIARDRPGLLSEITAVLADLNFNVAAAEAWTHNRRIACVLYVNDNVTSRAVDDPERLSAMEEQLNNVLRGCEQEDEKIARTSLSIGSTHVDRRLHQMLFADKDYEAVAKLDDSASLGLKPKITVEHCAKKVKHPQNLTAMTTVSSASAAVTEVAKVVTPRCKKSGRIGKLRVLCRYGGSVVSLPGTKSPRYVGGDTRIVAVPPSVEMSFVALVSHLKVTLGFSYDFKVKYQLPDQELDSLISVETDEDVEIMMEEHGYISSSDSLIPQSRIRLFLFPLKPQLNEIGAENEDPAECKAVTDADLLGLTGCELTQPVLEHPKTDTWFVDALKGVEMMQNGGNNSASSGSGDGNGGICGQESMNLDTNSSFGSSSSSVPSSNVPAIRTTGEDKMANTQVKFAPIESVASDNTAVTPVSPHEQMARPHVLENRVSSDPYDAELHKQVPVPVAVYPPFINQAQQQQQHFQVIYTGNPPMTLPATAYHHTNHIHYQFPPQPYPIYYIPVEHYSSRHIPAPPVRPDIVLNTHQVGSPVVRTGSPFAPELRSQLNFPPLPRPFDSSVQTSSEARSTTCGDASIFNTNLDDDTARAQIYKSQPPAPVVTSQYQTTMLNEAIGQLRTHNA